MKIVKEGATDYLEVHVEGENDKLNPYRINISQIRYIREYFHNSSAVKEGYIIQIGGKSLITKEELFNLEYKIGDWLKLGEIIFVAEVADSLTEKKKCIHFINYNNVFFKRKFIDKPSTDNNSEKNNKNVIDNTKKIDKFAVITIDERMIITQKVRDTQ